MTNVILVVGGAGYVGSHTCMALAESGYTPVVYDNFSHGHREFVQWGDYVEGDIRDREQLRSAFQRFKPDAVLHFAALIEVGESTARPAAFYDNNVAGSIALIEEAERFGVEALVFSSTCATYGEPRFLPLDETHPQVPLNPYGQSKLIVERVLSDMDKYANLRSVCLRYFNAAGADPEARIGEWHEPETHAIPIALDNVLGLRDGFRVNGDDYDTRDGTCIRDYIHVLDLADAHVRAVKYLLGGGSSGVYNLGTGTGTSVRELLKSIEVITGKSFSSEAGPRREGDSPVLVADNTKARSDLGWTPVRNLDQIISDAWKWHLKLQTLKKG